MRGGAARADRRREWIMRPARQLALLITTFALVVAACGGAGPLAGGTDPASVARQAMAVLAAGDITKLTDLACAASKESIANSLTGGLGELGSGAEAAALLQAIKIDTSKVTVGEATVTGDTAVVPLKGSMTISFDKEKVKPIVQAALQAQGVAADDAAVEAAMGFLTAFEGQAIPLDQPLTLKQENGAWKLCEEA
jgi:hypothetical protein